MVSNRFVFSQKSSIGAIMRVAALATVQKVKGSEGVMPQIPSPEIRGEVSPLSPDLVKTYIKAMGGDPRAYRGILPPHLFSQWGFGYASRTLEGLPYPLMAMVNGGCRLEVNAPLPADQTLQVRAQLIKIEDNGSRAIIHQRIVTGTSDVPDALVAHMTPIVVYKRSETKKKRPRASVPLDATEVAFWKIKANKGLDFAKLTGDFNPIHWIPGYARAMGFKSTILHGFATMAMAMEGLNKGLYSGSPALKRFDVRFTRPMTLPARVGLFIKREENGGSVWVGDALGGDIYMTGTYEGQLKE